MIKEQSLSGTRFGNIYKGIRTRCNNPRRHDFKFYGGRGIECKWNSLAEFKKDMYQSYQSSVEQFGEKNTTIERKNGNRNYSKENCYWATLSQQRRNYSQNVKVNFRNETYCLIELSEKFGVKYDLLYRRFRTRNWTIEKALFTPVRS
jgi:hypothetical protein